MTLSTKGAQFVEQVPFYYHSERNALGVLDSLAREAQRLEDFITLVAAQTTPQNADDTYGILGLYEFTLGLPVKPVGIALEQRRNRVLSAVRKRRSGAASDWRDNVTTALGTNQWTATENTPGNYQVTVTLPYSPTATTTLNGAHTLPVTPIAVVNAAVLSTTGTVRIGDQFVNYTGKSGNTLTGCTGGTGTWVTGTSVTQGTQSTVAQAGLLLNEITPAHIDLIIAYTTGFQVDISAVDLEPIN